MNLPTFDVPPLGPVQGKVWGRTQLVMAWNSVEVHRLYVVAGGYCSVHLHKSKWNRFVVLSGKLLVLVWHDEESEPDETILTAGQITDVPPGTRHQFEAMEESLVMEIYWVQLDASDIQRETHGGKRNG